jgi:hypothetical protein
MINAQAWTSKRLSQSANLRETQPKFGEFASRVFEFEQERAYILQPQAQMQSALAEAFCCPGLLGS